MLRDWGQHNVSWLGFVRETMVAHEGQLTSLSTADTMLTLFSDLQRIGTGLEQAHLEAALTASEAGDIFRALRADLLKVGGEKEWGSG